MLTIKSAGNLKYLTLQKSSHTVSPMALQRLSCAVISKRHVSILVGRKPRKIIRYIDKNKI